MTAEVFDSGGSVAGSSSYALRGKIRERALPVNIGTSFAFNGGFLRSVYFSAPTPPALAPIVISIAPSSGLNSGPVNITGLVGANFRSGAAVKLSKSGESDINAVNVVVVNSGQITCSFDIAGAAAGLWNVSVINPDGGSGSLPSAFTIGFPAPTVASITPARGTNDGVVEIIDLAGGNFRSGATVSLSKAGQSAIAGENVVVISSAKINCRFNLAGKEIGIWDLSVTNDDGQFASLPLGFKVEAASIGVVGTVVSTSNPFNPAAGPTTLKYTLTKDADITLYIYNIRGERVWQRFFSAGTAGGQVGVNEINWDGLTDFKSLVSFGVYILDVTTKEDGKIKGLSRTKIAIVK
ncbi:MAG: hypothetical protein WCW67_04495 [Candidatus Margulisiibacteriota bacterium]